MDKILFINACVGQGSRTLELTNTLLQKLKGDIQEVKLFETQWPILDQNGIEKRNKAELNNDFSDPLFSAAKQFAAADIIVIAAPYWDLMFPAVLKTYLENIVVGGITFDYSHQGIPKSLCKARELYYVTTSGGYIGQNDFGFSYIKALAQNFFGITQIHRYSAEGLDMFGVDVDEVLSKAKATIIAEASDI